MTVYEFYKFLDKIYPKELSCPWDNDGIMCSRDPDASVRKVLVSLDATERALKYASEGEFDLLLTHHPMIFRKLEAVTPATLDVAESTIPLSKSSDIPLRKHSATMNLWS